MNDKVNRKAVIQNIEKDEEDTRRMMKRTSRFSMNEEEVLRKKIKTRNEEVLVLKLENGSNLRISWNATAFDGVKEIIENTVGKSNKVKHLGNEN